MCQPRPVATVVFLRVPSLKHLSAIHCPCCTAIGYEAYPPVWVVGYFVAHYPRLAPLDIFAARRITSKSEMQ
jgi:hypothetical protein